MIGYCVGKIQQLKNIDSIKNYLSIKENGEFFKDRKYVFKKATSNSAGDD